MAGSLNVLPESKAVGYCCFIVVMPAEGISRFITVALMRLTRRQCGASKQVSGQEGRGMGWVGIGGR